MAAETETKAKESQDPNETLAAEAEPLDKPSEPNQTTKETLTAPVTDLQKKMLRAERFGMSVQLSEEEKRNSRAERFGTGSNIQKSSELKKSEELKRKARAERFGLPTQSIIDEEAKKKARLARFAPVSKTDAVEEEKKKARAIRFSQQPSGTSSEVNGESNSLKETAIVGKAGEGA
ncbi:hypothetical protein Syun_001299 [Stephania yunnanensis]|uniref:THO1-MOS11 C-terminal domain-containing protein n=1 Tax=Stephania yunnanensis TaxID=152371 RepID=A0AAP0LJ46_9MAGN